MKTLEKLDTECYNCLETLLKLETRDLKNELEQLLYTLQEKGVNLKDLNNYLLKGGCRQNYYPCDPNNGLLQQWHSMKQYKDFCIRRGLTPSLFSSLQTYKLWYLLARADKPKN